jgi:hypothetical protein
VAQRCVGSRNDALQAPSRFFLRKCLKKSGLCRYVTVDYSKVCRMAGIIGKISALLGIRRDGRGPARSKRKAAIVRRANDTVTISAEARRLFASGAGDGADDERAR